MCWLILQNSTPASARIPAVSADASVCLRCSVHIPSFGLELFFPKLRCAMFGLGSEDSEVSQLFEVASFFGDACLNLLKRLAGPACRCPGLVFLLEIYEGKTTCSPPLGDLMRKTTELP